MSKKQFKLLAGKHRDENRKEYVAGDIVESDRDLAAQFVNKFAPVGPADAPVVIEAPKDDKPPANDDKPPAGGDSDADHGKDITDDYVDAIDAGLKVYTKGGWCCIIDPETGEKLNDAGVRENAVADFIEGHLAQ